MIWFLIAQIVTVLLDIVTLSFQAGSHKDLELLVLRQQIRLLQRRLVKPIQASYAEKLFVALLAVRFKERVNNGQKRLNKALFIFKPETVLKWHRGLVKRKWTFEHKVKRGRPCIEAALQ